MRFHITGQDTDLKFSIKDIPVIPCTGERNIPDGECFTAPVRESVNGVIHFNTPTLYQGTVFNDICLHFESGQIVDASANNSEKLNDILDTDQGRTFLSASFAIGFNPYINNPMLDILFDEKIAGSFHFTPGQAYEVADNGVRSSVHWDMVMIQTPEHGGGEISFDGKLIRKDGRFVLPELEGLNPENFACRHQERIDSLFVAHLLNTPIDLAKLPIPPDIVKELPKIESVYRQGNRTRRDTTASVSSSYGGSRNSSKRNV